MQKSGAVLGEVRDDDDISLSFSISSESLVSAVPSTLPSPLNTSKEGSYYSSLPDLSSAGNSDKIAAAADPSLQE